MSVYSSINFANECEWFNSATFRPWKKWRWFLNMCMNHKKVKKNNFLFRVSRNFYTKKEKNVENLG